LARNRRLLARLAAPVALSSLTAVVAIATIAALALPAKAQAQELYTYTVGVLGGIGGSFDVERNRDFGNHGYQIDLAMVTEPNTEAVLRVGRLALDRDHRSFGALTHADLSYANIGGEYRLHEAYYDSGLFLALGAYRLRGDRADGSATDQTAIGAALGVTGEFPINRHLGIVVELTGHYSRLAEAKIFATGHAGVAFHF
jgi:hypothetical protein